MALSNTNEEDLFVIVRRKMKRSEVYDPRVEHDILKFKVIQRYKDAVECKLL